MDTGVLPEDSDILEVAEKVISGGADILQLRAKNWSDGRILKVGQAIKNLVRKSQALFVLNDRADLAHAIEADGVHLGQKDLKPKDARGILGSKRIIGLSTHSIAQAEEAESQGVDYIGLGPIFATATKPESAPLGPKIICQVKEKVKIPFVAIGGIGLDNLDRVLKAGAKGVAVCRAIITAKDIATTTKEFRQRLMKRQAGN